MSAIDENARAAAALAFHNAVEAASRHRGLLDPALKIPADKRKHTPEGQSATQAGAHHRAAIEHAIRATDRLTTALRVLTRADQYGQLGAGLVGVSLAASEVYEAIEAMDQRLYPLAAPTLLPAHRDPEGPVDYWPATPNTSGSEDQA